MGGMRMCVMRGEGSNPYPDHYLEPLFQDAKFRMEINRTQNLILICNSLTNKLSFNGMYVHTRTRARVCDFNRKYSRGPSTAPKNNWIYP